MPHRCSARALARTAVTCSTIALCTAPALSRADSTWDLVDATNAARRDHGLGPLRVDDSLLKASATHARDMATRNYFSHWTPEGWDFATRIFGWGYSRWAGVAENIAAGQTDAWAVVRAWLASPGHRANLLNPSMRSQGSGHFYATASAYRHYWVGHYGTD
jgi:uncharacterized protein YkwD